MAGNIGKARLMDNDGILEGTRNIGIRVFGEERYDELGMRAKLVRIGVLMTNGRVVDKNVVERVIGQGINMAEYFRLRNVLAEIIRIFGPINEEGKCLDEFMRSRKRGGGMKKGDYWKIK